MALLLEFTITTPANTVTAARTLVALKVSIPTYMLIAMAIIGCTYEYMLTRVGRMCFWPKGIRKYAMKVAQIIRKESFHKYCDGRDE